MQTSHFLSQCMTDRVAQSGASTAIGSMIHLAAKSGALMAIDSAMRLAAKSGALMAIDSAMRLAAKSGALMAIDSAMHLVAKSGALMAIHSAMHLVAKSEDLKGRHGCRPSYFSSSLRQEFTEPSHCPDRQLSETNARPLDSFELALRPRSTMTQEHIERQQT